MNFIHYSIVLFFLGVAITKTTDARKANRPFKNQQRGVDQNNENVLGEGRFATNVFNKLMALKTSLKTKTTAATTTTTTTTTTAPPGPTGPTGPTNRFESDDGYVTTSSKWIRIPIHQIPQIVEQHYRLHKEKQQQQQQKQQRRQQQRLREQAIDEAIQLVRRELIKQHRQRQQQAQKKRKQVNHRNINRKIKRNRYQQLGLNFQYV